MVDVSQMPDAVIESDEDDGHRLVIFAQGNGDWYVQLAPAGEPAIGFREQVRICTSGSRLGDIPFAVALLYKIAVGQTEDAAMMAEALAKVLSAKL